MALKNDNEYAEKLIKAIGVKIGVDTDKYHMSEMVKGMSVELEHGSVSPETNVTDDDPAATFKIMIKHLNEFADYYTRLDKMEKQGESNKEEPESEGEEKEENEDEIDVKEEINESISNRYKELCGIKEKTDKKQLCNEHFKLSKKLIIKESQEKNKQKEVIEEAEFKKVEFDNDGLGDDGKNRDLYTMKDGVEPEEEQPVNEE